MEMNTDITKQMEMVLYRTEDDNATTTQHGAMQDKTQNMAADYRYFCRMQQRSFIIRQTTQRSTWA
jgi:hypothetical protein